MFWVGRWQSWVVKLPIGLGGSGMPLGSLYAREARAEDREQEAREAMEPGAATRPATRLSPFNQRGS